MGQPVTVDSDDLETLLFATGAIKAVEAALQQRKNDPLWKRAEPNLRGAHDRAAAAWRSALRTPDMLPSGDPPTKDQLKWLRGVPLHRHPTGTTWRTPTFPAMDAAREKGWVEFSPVLDARVWPGEDALFVDTGHRAARRTIYGDALVEEAA